MTTHSSSSSQPPEEKPWQELAAPGTYWIAQYDNLLQSYPHIHPFDSVGVVEYTLSLQIQQNQARIQQLHQEIALAKDTFWDGKRSHEEMHAITSAIERNTNLIRTLEIPFALLRASHFIHSK